MNLDSKTLRSAFGRFLTGVTVITTRAPDGDLVGFTANSFTSVSLNPPLVLVCPGKHLLSFDTFRAATRFGVSVLAEGQKDISTRFASSKADRFAAADWTTPHDGIPLITGRAAGFVCDTHQWIDAGDHGVLIGRVRYFDDAALPGLGFGPTGYFNRSDERKAEAPRATLTHASALLEVDGGVLLTNSHDLPTVDVPPGQSPLKTLQSALLAQGIDATLGVVFAIYGEANGKRRIVFRGMASGVPLGLISVPIGTLAEREHPDPALHSLLTRFAREHAAQSYGLYIGDEAHGDVLPAQER